MSCQCEKCGKVMDEVQFYTYKNGKKTEQCKKCLTMFVDNFDPTTFLWILEKLDVPYIPEEWNVIRDKAVAKANGDLRKLNGTSVIGKYLSKMKLTQWNKYGWADTEKIKAEKELKLVEMTKEKEESDKEIQKKFDNGEINEFEYKTLMSTTGYLANLPEPEPAPAIGVGNMFNEEDFIDESELNNIGEDLTKEDKLYLALKWGRLYKPSEWVELETNYKKMSDDFGVEDPDSENNLILICKTNLKANQALDSGDIDGFQKLSKVLDSLRKSGNFTKAQNKEKDGKTFDAVCEIVNLCEMADNGGFIPRHKVTVDFDIADKDLRDMKGYTKSLIEEDPTVFKMIEEFIKKREILAEMEQNEINAEEDENGNKIVMLTDDDFKKYSEHTQKQRDLDERYNEDEEDYDE